MFYSVFIGGSVLPTLYFLDSVFLVFHLVLFLHFLKIRAEEIALRMLFFFLLGVRNDFSLINSFFACHHFGKLISISWLTTYYSVQLE